MSKPYSVFPKVAIGYRLLPWLALVVGIALTLWIWTLTLDNLRDSRSNQFVLRAEQLRLMLERRLQSYEQLVRGAAALVSTSEEVTWEEWQNYSRLLQADEFFPGLEGLAFFQRVMHQDRQTHEDLLRREGLRNYRIRAAGERLEYFPLVYLAPPERFPEAMGFDAYSDPVRASAMRLARDTGEPVMTRRLALATADAPIGLVIYAPVFQGGGLLRSVAQRQERLLGFVGGAFVVSAVLQQMLGEQPLLVNFSIHDGVSLGEENRLYRYRPPQDLDADLQHRISITVAGRLWTLHFTPLAEFYGLTNNQTPKFVLSGGLLVSALLFFLTRALLASRHLLGILQERGAALEQQIRQRKRMEETLKHARDAAEAASRAKSAFLANVSHELRTPLNGILGYSQILDRDQELAEHHRDGLRIIRQSGDYLLTIVNDLLDISQVESDQLRLYPGDIAFIRFLKRIAESFRHRAADKGLYFETHLGADLPAGVQADEKRLRQLLVNLLSNAVKFTERGGVHFLVDRVDAECFNTNVTGIALTETQAPKAIDGATLIRFQVEDSGCGIEAAQFEDLTRPFYQIGRVTQKAEGLGVGLALCRELVDAMGGTLQLWSKPNQGSRFWAIVPLLPGEALGAAGAIDEEPEIQTVLHDEPLVMDVTQAERLRDLAMMGDVNGLLAYFTELEAGGDFTPTPRLRRMVHNFQLEEIAELAAAARPLTHP